MREKERDVGALKVGENRERADAFALRCGARTCGQCKSERGETIVSGVHAVAVS